MNEKAKRAQSIVGTSKGKPKDEFYPTPPDAVHALLSVWKPRYHHNLGMCLWKWGNF